MPLQFDQPQHQPRIKRGRLAGPVESVPVFEEIETRPTDLRFPSELDLDFLRLAQDIDRV
jgi:hypothetical protein